MDRLKTISDHLVKNCLQGFYRFIYFDIKLDKRIHCIVGGRGSGKTTILLQIIKGKIPKEEDALYLSLDDPLFSNTRLIEIVNEFYKRGGSWLILDEVQKYTDIAKEIPVLLDECPDLKIVCASSIDLALVDEGSKLENQISIYYLPGLSYREFLEYKYLLVFPKINFDDLLELNRIPGAPVLNRIRPLQYFDEYLRYGYYFGCINSPGMESLVIAGIINRIVDSDLSPLYNLDNISGTRLKIILMELALSGPLKPNIERQAKGMGTTRDSLLKFLTYLEQTELIIMLGARDKRPGKTLKPKRLYPGNSALISTLPMDYPGNKNLYESFLVSQLRVHHKVDLSHGNSLIIDDEYTFGMDWLNHSGERINSRLDYHIKADIDYQSGTNIPLWMLGFLY